jgi:hypothetical protein
MSLLDVQRSLVGFARGSTDAYQRCHNLTPPENEWLKQVLDSPGLHVTQQIQQWWRIGRVCSTAPMTIELLKRNGQAEFIIDYITTEPVRTLFFAAELDQFKCFLQRHPQVDATTKTMIAFEAGIKHAVQLAEAKGLAQAEHFSLSLTFSRNPPALFIALLTGAPLPAIEPEAYYLEIDPLLESLWIFHRANNHCEHNSHNNCHNRNTDRLEREM